MRAVSFVLLACLSLLAAMPAKAVLPLPTDTAESEEPAPAPTPAPAIEPVAEEGSDELIARRIRGIFGELPAFQEVEVEVNEGVVTLSGRVAEDAAIARAEAIASRISGVATVENGLERDVSIGANISTLGGVRGKLESLVAMLPLIGLAIALAALISAIGYLLASFDALWRRLAANGFLAELIASAIRFVFVIGGIVVALQMIGASALLGAVLGGAGLIGIALGFAMRDTVENYVASIMLSVRQPFRANDWVVIDHFEGRVIRLTSRATILMTLDGNHLRIPNGTVFKAVILNYTRNPQRRFDFVLGIDAEDDPTAARQLGVDILSGLDFVLSEPAPSARVEDVGDSNIVIRFLGWIDQDSTDWYKARSLAIPAVKDALEQAGFALPEPIYRLRFDAGAPAELAGVAQDLAKAPRHKPARAPVRAEVTVEDETRPEDHIADLVKQEREEAPEARTDLLDSNRPVE